MLETCTGIKLTHYKTRICALSWLITKTVPQCFIRLTQKRLIVQENGYL